MDNLPELESSLPVDTIMTLVYIAGYVVRNDDPHTYFYFEKYGSFTNEMNRGSLTIPGDSACQWVIYSYVMFHQVVDYSCRTSLCNVLIVVSELYKFNMNRSHAFILSNISYTFFFYKKHVYKNKNKYVREVSGNNL